jgi:titin
VQVTWTAPVDDGGFPVTAYLVEVWSFGSVWTDSIVPASPTATTIGGLMNGIPYTVTVTAINAAGAGATSAPSAEVVPAGPMPVPVPVNSPSAPAMGVATAGKASAVVRWAAPADDGGAPITAYEVRAYRGGLLVGVAAAPAGATAVTVTGLVNGRPHTFAVSAINSFGTGPESALSPAVTPRTVPGAPKIAKVSPARRAVVVKWAAPASNGGASITGWLVRTYAGTKLVKSTIVRAAANSVSVAGLTGGRSYTFRVQAKNVAGAGAWSGASKAVKPNR